MFSRLIIHHWRQFNQVEIDFHRRLTVLTGINGSGKTTLLHLLNRWDLIQKRAKRLKRLEPLIEQWRAHPSGATKNILRNAILDEAADAVDYAATVRACLKQVLGWDCPPADSAPDVAVATSG